MDIFSEFGASHHPHFVATLEAYQHPMQQLSQLSPFFPQHQATSPQLQLEDARSSEESLQCAAGGQG